MLFENLVIDTFGTFLSKKSEVLVVKNKDTSQIIPILKLNAIHIISNGVSISSDVVELCSEKGIPILFANKIGRVYGMFHNASLNATVVTKRKQLESINTNKSMVVIKEVLKSKIKNQRTLINYFSRNDKEIDTEDFNRKMDGILSEIEEIQETNIDTQLRQILLLLEANSAKYYWNMFSKFIKNKKVVWKGREHRYATDIVNKSINYSYGILYGIINLSIMYAGLDPFVGFLHTDKSGKESLLYDLIEPYRIFCDKIVIRNINLSKAIQLDENDGLTQESRKLLVTELLEELSNKEEYKTEQLSIKSIIQRDIYQLASYLRDDSPMLSFYEWSWR